MSNEKVWRAQLARRKSFGQPWQITGPGPIQQAKLILSRFLIISQKRSQKKIFFSTKIFFEGVETCILQKIL
jgi:hypothetical protein